MVTINTETKLYGVLGNPIGHSKSPLIFNHAFSKDGINAVYLAFGKEDASSVIAAVRALGICGLSVTIPHKEALMDLVDVVDETVCAVGCINTVINDEGVLTGYNYDSQGALVPLFDQAPDLLSRPVFFIGGGGAARGIALALAKRGLSSCNFVVRNPAKIATLREQMEAASCSVQLSSFEDINENGFPSGSIIIQTTPVGMSPNVYESPLAAHVFDSTMLVYDIIYNPLYTKLLRDAKDCGAMVISGVEMFLGQASLQYKLWTGREAPREEWRHLLGASE